MPSPEAEKFYREILTLLTQSGIPFMVGGTYAFTGYTRIPRPTKDLDLITTKRHAIAILALLKKKGYATELLNPLWIGKVYHDDFFVDIIFAERNNIYQVKSSWFALARKGKILGHEYLLLPIEYMISTKMYVRFRGKYDGSDINYLLLYYANHINWQILMKQAKPHWQLLCAHLLLFGFVFPGYARAIPSWVMKKYIRQIQKSFDQTILPSNITQGHLISYEYAYAIKKLGFKPVNGI